MTRLRVMRFVPVLILASAFLAACGSGASETRQVPIGPSPPSGPGGGSGTVTLSTPAPVSPANNEQLSTLRPTLTVQNATSSNQSGTRTYEFQVSDRTDFTMGASLTTSFLVAVNQTGVGEGPDGRTSFTPSSDLQPATRMYWRARVVQGSSSSDWSSPAMFRTKLVGYNRPGELYDPLIHSESIGAISGAHTWIPGRGLRLDTERSYVRYQLGEAITNGEFSVEVEGLHPGGPDHKLKVFTMNDRDADPSFSDMYMAAMYRGINGNPPNCISFKAVFGNQTRIAEPNSPERNASVRMLNPARTYFWKATWGSEFRLLVLDGGIAGNSIYEMAKSVGGTLRGTHAWLGSNQAIAETDAGTFPGATYRNLWVGNKPRPSTLGNALD
jgi:hypothetical protein